MEEKRRHKRLSLDVEIELERLEQDGIKTLRYIQVEVNDISRSGLGFEAKTKLEVDAYYDTKIQIWTKETFSTVLHIVRENDNGNGNYSYGGEFIGMSDVDALKIDIYQIFNDV